MNASAGPASLDSGAAIETIRGEVVRIDYSLQTIVNLRREAAAAVRIEATATWEADGKAAPLRVGRGLCEEDLARIDEATLQVAGQLLAEGRAAPALIVPMSFFTLAARRGRQALSDIGGAATDLLRASVMVEVTDVDKGTPASRLTEVAGLVASICRAVLVRVQPTRDMVATVRGFRPQGLCIDGADLSPLDSEAANQLLRFGEQAKGVAPLLIAQGLPNDGFFHVAEVAGLTHASLRAPAAVRQRPAA